VLISLTVRTWYGYVNLLPVYDEDSDELVTCKKPGLSWRYIKYKYCKEGHYKRYAKADKNNRIVIDRAA